MKLRTFIVIRNDNDNKELSEAIFKYRFTFINYKRSGVFTAPLYNLDL